MVFLYRVWKNAFSDSYRRGAVWLALLWILLALPVPAQQRRIPVLAQAEAGDTVLFGSWFQGESAEVAPIEWIVLAKDATSLTLLSLKGLDTMPFNARDEECGWEGCTVRQWLNGSFLEHAFSQAEQMLLLKMQMHNTPNTLYGTLPGSDTEDRVSMLNMDEAECYLYAPRDRICRPTDYCVNKGAYLSEDGLGWWWLRSPGATKRAAVCVYLGGEIIKEGALVTCGGGCVRPVIKVMI